MLPFYASLYFKFLLIANALVAIETDVAVGVAIVVEIGVVVVEAVVGIVVGVVVEVELLGMQLVSWLGQVIIFLSYQKVLS